MNPTEIAVSLGALLAVMLAVAVMLGRGLPEPVDIAPGAANWRAGLKPSMSPGAITWLPMPPRFRFPYNVMEDLLAHYEQMRHDDAIASLNQDRADVLRWADDGGR